MLSKFAKNFEMDDLVPEILSTLHFLRFWGAYDFCKFGQ